MTSERAQPSARHYREIWYSITEDHGPSEEPPRHRLVLGCRMVSPRDIAERCAEDYFDTHDGWEAAWPLTFVLYADARSAALGTFSVSIESRPTFTAEAIK